MKDELFIASESVRCDEIVFFGLQTHHFLVRQHSSFLLSAKTSGQRDLPASDRAQSQSFLPTLLITPFVRAAQAWPYPFSACCRLGGLATAIFDRIAANDGARGLFSAEAAAEYSRVLAREVRIEEIQPAVNELLGANLIMRRSHGVYGVTDPFVQDTWLAQKHLSEVP
jgi:hypothetical protein